MIALAVALLLGGPPKPDRCAPRPQLYIAPMGEPFRAAAGLPYPSVAWFAQADRDGDGRLTSPEFAADADAFFTRLDTDANGEIEPAEVTAYETDIAPEIRLYQRLGERTIRPDASGYERRRGAAYGDALGAGRWAQLNVPHPVASADLDMDRAVTRAEWRTVAVRRHALLGAAPLTLAALKPTPEQAAALACAAKRR